MQNRSTKHQSGLSLLEILVAVTIFSIGFLALSGMHLIALRTNTTSLQQSIATTQVHAMAERLRANQSIENVQRETKEWQQELARLLPKGQGEVTKQGQDYIVTARWDGERNNGKKLTTVSSTVRV